METPFLVMLSQTLSEGRRPGHSTPFGQHADHIERLADLDLALGNDHVAVTGTHEDVANGPGGGPLSQLAGRGSLPSADVSHDHFCGPGPDHDASGRVLDLE